MTVSLSASQLTMFQRCAEQWRRRHLEEELLPPTLPVHTGRAVREAVHLALRRRMETGLPMPPEDVADAAATAYARSLRGGVYMPPDDLPSARAALAAGRDTVVALTALFCRELAPKLRPALAGHRVELDLGLALPVAVTIDCLTVDGELHHLPTASRRWSTERLHGSAVVVLAREAVRRRERGLCPPGFVDVLVGARTPVLQTLKAPCSPDEIVVLTRKFRLMLTAVQAGIFPPAAPESWNCSPRWCGYFYSCPHVPAFRKRLPAALHGVLAGCGSAFAV